MQMQMKCIGITLLALLVAAPMAVAGQNVPGVTATEVVIGITTPLSGPAAAWGNTALGQEAWVKYINDQGGINGRTIRVVIKDDAYLPGRALANISEMKDSVFAIVGIVGTATSLAIVDTVTENKIPFVGPFANVQRFKVMPKAKLRYVFQTYPDYADETAYIVETAVTKVGVKKLAVFYQNDEYGKGGLEGVERAMEKLLGKATLVVKVSYELADRDLSIHALKIKESGADGVILVPTPTHAALIVKGMAKVGYRPKIFGNFTVGDRRVMLKLAGELWEGAYANVVGSTYDYDEAANRVGEILIKNNPRLEARIDNAIFGAARMMVALEGIRRAGRDLTRERFIQALESIRNWKAAGLLPAITFGPNQHHSANAAQMMQVVKGDYVAVTELTYFPSHF